MYTKFITRRTFRFLFSASIYVIMKIHENAQCDKNGHILVTPFCIFKYRKCSWSNAFV